MSKEEKCVNRLEVGRDYINVNDLNTIVIDRCGDYSNKGFYGAYYQSNISCFPLPKIWREATEEEVIEAFKKHLVKRYGEDWKTMKIKERHPSSSLFEINDSSWNVEISKRFDGWIVWNRNGLLYCNGIWVERLEEENKPKIHIKEAFKENTVIHCETVEEAVRILGMAESPAPEDIKEIKAGEEGDKRYALKRDVLTILSVESRLNPDKKISEYLEQFRIILEVL